MDSALSQEKYKYNSPTTAGLKIDFRNYIIELICLNIDYKLSYKFWKSTKWSKKYKREICGFYRFTALIKEQNINDPHFQKCFITIIKKYKIKSLTFKKTQNFLLKKLKEEIEKTPKVNNNAKQEIVDIDHYMQKNIVNNVSSSKNKLKKIREIENNG